MDVDGFMPNLDPKLAHIVARIPSGWGKWISCGPGWHSLILKLDADLAALYPDYELHQCKEKFGGLRYYTGPLPEGAYDLIRQAEEDSFTICEVCGNPGKPNEGRGWISTLCEEHRDVANNPQ